MEKKHFINTYYSGTELVPTDIYPVQYGEEQCESGHDFGPCIRGNYLIHYVYKGKGTLTSEGRTYSICEKQLFLICPDRLAYYKADDDEPWLYRWIEFNGSLAPDILKAAGLSESSPVIEDNSGKTVGNTLSDIVGGGDMRFEVLMQKLWAFVSALTKNYSPDRISVAEQYVRKAEMFIKTNTHKKITVREIADYIGIDRSYLCGLFRQYKNTSPQQYILALKMNTAAHYLKNTQITVAEAASCVGYSDPHVFSKAFKNHFGRSPQRWREEQDWKRSIIGS